jgi:hypothetical protein
MHTCDISGGLRAPPHTEFGKQSGNVILDRLLGGMRTLADLPVGEAFADQAEDFPLPVGELSEPVVRTRAATVAQPLRHARGGDRIQQGLPGGDVPYRPEQLIARIAFRTYPEAPP